MDHRICPICCTKYTDIPAISRDDNKTEICPDCGVKQALKSIGVKQNEWKPILEIIHAWERRKKIHVVEKGENV